MTATTQKNIHATAALVGLFLSCLIAATMVYAAMRYPFRIEQMETVTIPEIKARQLEIRREMATDRIRASETRDLLLRIDERLQQVQRELRERQ